MAKTGDQNGRKTGGKKSYTGNRGPVSHSTPSWPCEIDGCGKQFVREADLRRHQRTTRVHANPNYVCGNCGASFTRTDALKRHEKSKNHVTRAPSPNSSTFIEDGTTTTSTETKATTDTSPELSTRSRSSRSLSPGPARVKEKGHKERERKRGDRALPPLQAPVPSGYYRHSVATPLYEHSSVPSNPWPTASFSRLQTHSTSLNAILASPISTPRLHPVDWSLLTSGQSKTTQHNDNSCAQTPSPPLATSLPSSIDPNNQNDAPHYRYPRSPRMVPQLIPENPTSTSRELASYGYNDHTPSGRLDTCHATLPTRTDSDSNGNEIATSVTSAIGSGERTHLTPSLSPTLPVQLASPPIVASTEPILTLVMLTDDDADDRNDGAGNVSNSSDSDGTEESDEEVDQLESTDSETELVKSEDKIGPNPADVRSKHLAPIKSVTVREGTGNQTSTGHSIPEIDIEACIDPVATGITKEEVKAAMDDMRKQEQAEQQEQQQRRLRRENHDHDGPLGALDMGMGINIRASNTGVDHGGLPFLNEIVLSSPSSALAENDAGVVNDAAGQTRQGQDHSSGSDVDPPYVHQSPGSRTGRQSPDSNECHSLSSFLGGPRDNFDSNLHHHRLNSRHRSSYRSHDEKEGAESHMSRNEDLDIKMVYSVVDVDAGRDVGIGRQLEKTVDERVSADAIDVDGVNDSPESDSWHGRNHSHIHDAYGGGNCGGQYSSPSLDWSPSLFTLERYHQYSHSRHHGLFDEDEGDGEHMLQHRHTCHQHHPTELLAQVTMPL